MLKGLDTGASSLIPTQHGPLVAPELLPINKYIVSMRVNSRTWEAALSKVVGFLSCQLGDHLPELQGTLTGNKNKAAFRSRDSVFAPRCPCIWLSSQ